LVIAIRGGDGSLQAARDVVDRLRVGADGIELAVFAPAGDVRDALAAHVQPDRAADDVGVDEDLGAPGPEVAVAESEGVRELVK